MLSGFGPNDAVYRSVGLPITGVEIRINEPDPETGEGEIVAKGRNIMQGYYRNEAQTKEVFTEDGYFRTGDLGVIDKKGIIYIKGRSKDMILGANGENIYPEEIESIINEQEFVADSLVMDAKGKLVALVHLNFDKIEEKFKDMKSSAHDIQIEIQQKADELMEERRGKERNRSTARCNPRSRSRVYRIPDHCHVSARIEQDIHAVGLDEDAQNPFSHKLGFANTIIAERYQCDIHNRCPIVMQCKRESTAKEITFPADVRLGYTQDRGHRQRLCR